MKCGIGFGFSRIFFPHCLQYFLTFADGLPKTFQMKKCFIIIVLCLVLPFIAAAQVAVERSKEIVKIGTKEYYMHHVKPGETLYSISKAYGVSVEEITQRNPEVSDGLQAEMVIGIPVIVVEDGSENVGVSNDSLENQKDTEKTYTVQSGETLYDIAKKFGIDLADFKALNSGLDNYPRQGMVLRVPNIRNEEAYIVHTVEEGRRTSSLLREWDVDAETFRALNPAVGSEVFKNQKVLIPIERVVFDAPVVVIDDDVSETPEVEIDTTQFVVEEVQNVVCEVVPEYASQRYKVALLVPLYLNEVDYMNVSRENIEKVRKSKALTFIQFYEGFMLAVDSLKNNYGLNLDLTVIDVTENENSAHSAVRQMGGKNFDVIVGPFFSKSFNVVQSFAKDNGILIVNPLSNRESILNDNPYVVKMKPNEAGKMLQLAQLVSQNYKDSNVFIISKKNVSSSDSLRIAEIENLVSMSINSEVFVTAEDFMAYAAREARRRQMGNKVPSTLEVEGQIFATKDMKNGFEPARFENKVRRFVYASDDLKKLNAEMSQVRNNLIIAIDNDNVFATQLLNHLNKQADRYPITLLPMKDWSKLEKLPVESLLKLNAIYFSDCFVDFNTQAANQFVAQFRNKYTVEPTDYAFTGFDVAWYFLNALMRYGHDMRDCLPSYKTSLLSTPVHLMRKSNAEGVENYYWNIYQYDRQSIELRTVDIFETQNSDQ